MKSLVDTCRQLEDEGSGFPMHHRLELLWGEAERLIHQHYESDTPKEVGYVTALIKEFRERDPGGQSFRYPIDKKGNLSVVKTEKINVQLLAESMAKLGDFLDCIGLDLSERLQFKKDAESEYDF